MVKFSATPDQQEALDLMTKWLNEGYNNCTYFTHVSPYFLLKGYAGTGKSFSITELAKHGPFDPQKICFTAPTNKAVKVLRNYLDDCGLQQCETKTIYSLLGLSLQPNGEVKVLTKPEEPVDLSRFKVIVIDEASMVNKFLLSAINDAYDDWKVPFIFMGDPAQLPPVGELEAPIWAINNQYTLTKVLRYGNSMLDLATAIRNVVDHPFPAIKIDSKPPIYKVKKPEWIDSIYNNIELFRSGGAKVIAWRNVTVDAYNLRIRRMLFDTETAKKNTWLADDQIVATAFIKGISDVVILKTDESAVILNVTEGEHPAYPAYPVYNILVKDDNNRELLLKVLTDEGRRHHNNELNQLAFKAKSGERRLWKDYWELKEAFAEIRHSYALTSHRAQGSSYTKVFVDLEDIMLNRNRQEAFRSLYVACTRQREELWIT